MTRYQVQKPPHRGTVRLRLSVRTFKPGWAAWTGSLVLCKSLGDPAVLRAVSSVFISSVTSAIGCAAPRPFGFFLPQLWVDSHSPTSELSTSIYFISPCAPPTPLRPCSAIFAGSRDTSFPTDTRTHGHTV